MGNESDLKDRLWIDKIIFLDLIWSALEPKVLAGDLESSSRAEKLPSSFYLSRRGSLWIPILNII